MWYNYLRQTLTNGFNAAIVLIGKLAQSQRWLVMLPWYSIYSLSSLSATECGRYTGEGNFMRQAVTNEVGCLSDSDERRTSSRCVRIDEANYLR